MSTNLFPIAETGFKNAQRINRSLTASLEKRILTSLAVHAPRWVTSDRLTVLGLFAQVAAGLCYGLCRYGRRALVLVSICIVVNWLGDSLDGTLARVRRQQRPRYGFYVDHMVDVFGAVALLGGIGFSGLLHWQVAIAMLISFLLLATESYLATYTLGCFQMSQGLFGPTELRILLIAGNLVALHHAKATIFHHPMLLFDLGGVIAAAGMFLASVAITARHTKELYEQEPLS